MVALTSAGYGGYAASLQDPTIDPAIKFKIASEIKDSIEIVHSLEYPRFLTFFIPAFSYVLRELEPSFANSSPVHKLRNVILEVIHRFPLSESLRQYAPDLMSVLMYTLRHDNEENAVVALKVIVELHKTYKTELEAHVQGFFDIVQEMYGNMRKAVEDTFDDPSAVYQQPNQFVAPGNAAEDPNKVFGASMTSFKVLTECPIIIALLLQVHRTFVNENVPKFVPLIMEALHLQPKQQKEAHDEAEKNGTVFFGVSPKIKNRVAYSELKALQVKTASFIAYILRSFVQTLRPHQEEIADAIVGLLKDCPPEASSTRKELLVAIRHVWYTDFRTAFVKYFDVILNEDVLIGAGVTSHETLRPLAHSILVDLIHHIRGNLSETQLANTIHCYTRNLHDDTLAPSIQNMCSKLLINLVDCLGDSQKPINRLLLMRILEAFAFKFTALKNLFPSVMKHHHRVKSNPPNPISVDTQEATLSAMDGFVDLGIVQPVKSSMRAFDGSHDLVKDMRFVLKTLIQGIKPVLLALRAFNPASSGATPDLDPNVPVASGFSPEEVQLFVRIFRDGLKCFDYFVSENFGPDGEYIDKNVDRSAPLVAKEEKEVFESFATIFTLVEPCVFQDVFSTNMSYLFDRILLNGGLQAIPQYLLGLVNVPAGSAGSPNFTAVSPGFGGLLLRFLVDRIDRLSGDDQVYSSSMLRLFKVVFMAVTKFPEKNEHILKPHVGTIILKSMKLSATAKDPLNYFLLLRALFRSIGGGRFEALYQEVLPLLEVLLEGLNVLLSTAHKQTMKELFVELCLTVPVRLNVLLPYLSYLMKPLVLALQGGPELVSQGLRTLELCIDNLTQDFLEPIMQPVINDLMSALWRHLKPLPYRWEHSHTTLRILGKLGGRNRRLLNGPLELQYEGNGEAGIELLFSFNQKENKPQLLELDSLIGVAFRLLDDPDTLPFHQEQVFLFAKACLPLLVSMDTSFEQLMANVLTSTGDVEVDNAMEVDGAVPSPFIDPPPVKKEKKEANDKALSDIIFILFTCIGIPGLKDQAMLLIRNLCQHFAFLSVAESLDLRKKARGREAYSTIDTILNSPTSSIDGFITAVVRSMTCESGEQREFTEGSLKQFYHMCNVIVERSGDSIKLDELSVFHILASKFTSCCYKQEWYEKSAGCLGITLLTSQMNFGVKWMLDHELEFIKALLYVLKDVSPEMATVNSDSAKQALTHVLKVCNSHSSDEAAMEEDLQPQLAGNLQQPKSDRQAKFNSLISLLISELSNSNSAVRETIQTTFQQLAELTNMDVCGLLTPVRDRLLQPIFSKPLRALPFALQIGHIDAITYCLSLRPPLLQFDEQLLRLLNEALALADAEDQALVSKPSHYKNSASLTNLRVVCIKLLSAAMGCQDFSAPRQMNTRARIIAVFFKSLYAKSSEVVDAAYQGLAAVLNQQQKLPKELLQAGLKPILVNLQEYKRLTVPGLEGLARLLELLTSYFKVEIGKKLLDHCRQWAEAAVLSNAAGKPLSEIEEIRIMVAILNVFHLLPATANCFLEEMVQTVIDLEMGVRRTVSSPFKVPLIKFLNRYNVESTEFFLDRLHKPEYANLFVGILTEETAAPIRAELMENPDKLIRATFENGAEEGPLGHLQAVAIRIIKVLCSTNPEWLLQRPELGAHVRSHWNRIRNVTPLVELSVAKSDEYRNVLDVFIMIASFDPSQLEILFELLEGFNTNEVVDCGFLKMFFHDVVCLKFTPAQKRDILERFWFQFDNQGISFSLKTLALRYMIIPMLQAAVDEGCIADIIDQSVTDMIHQKVWLPAQPQDLGAIDDFLRAELLQFTAVMIQCAPINELKKDVKDVIKFVWNQLKVEDVTCKQAAYVVLAKFIKAYDTPSKICIQILVALLKAHQAEIRVLVKQALDVLIPVAPARIQDPPGGDPKLLPTWARWTKKVIIEDNHNLSQLLMIYGLLVRHSDIFFPYRNDFIGNIVSSLARLGLLPNATAETKTLSIDLCELILKWERSRVSEESKDPLSMAVDEDTQTSNHREMTIGFLIRFVSSNVEQGLRPLLVGRAVSVFKALLDIWVDANIRFSHFEKAVSLEMKEDNYAVIRDTVDMLQSIIERRSNSWIVSHLSMLQKPIEVWILSDNPSIIKPMAQVLDIAYKAAMSPEAAESTHASEVAAFIKMVETVTVRLQQSMSNVFALLAILKTVHESRPEVLDERMLTDLMKVLTKLSKEHLMNGTANAGSPAAETLTSMLVLILELVKLKMPTLKDYRRSFHDCLIQLITESQDITLLNCLLNIVDEWVFRHNEPFPTLKEKANLVVRMMIFDIRNDKDLSDKYLQLIASIYSDPNLARSELTVKLERAFLMGTKSDNPEIRAKFSSIFNSSLEPTLFPRLNYVIGIQNWEFLSKSFWIRQALDLLLGCINSRQPVDLSAPGYRVGAATFGIGSSAAMSIDHRFEPDHQRHLAFLADMRAMDAGLLLRATREFTYLDAEAASKLWIALFPLGWSLLNASERQTLTKLIILLLGKDYNLNQVTHRPNVVATILESVCHCVPAIQLPPQLVKYIAKNFNAWHISLELLQTAANAQRSVSSSRDEERVREITLDSLGDLLSSLSEDDYLSGLWRRRSLFAETNAAISFEQCGLWVQAQGLYENAQAKARTGLLPFTESEYNVWEDHWVNCAKRLQQWDILIDLAKHEGNTEMLLESAWRLSDWSQERESLIASLKTMPDAKNSRKKIFEALLSLLRAQEGGPVDRVEFKKLCDDGIQMALQNWFSLPTVVSNAHIPVLHSFQLFVELQEASQIQENLLATNVGNIEMKSQELKGILITWRERLPNVWDDIVLWSDLVAWRQHVFSTINKAYLPLIPQLQSQGGTQNPTSSYAYRGYHETAWIINRFSHVARKHQLTDVCISSLTKIYTLPNIEIPEAFYKLREQAKCHFQSPLEYPTGLDVINNTNLHYFSKPQSAEFFTLKGVFLSKMGLHPEAVEAFASATQMEMGLAKAWAAWGQYNDQLFKEQPGELEKYGVHALQCYLQSAGIYNNARSRKYISRIIWLMGLDNAEGTLAKTFENYKSETPLWYWITFIPQLLSALSGKEARYAKMILMKIAKQYPQALHFQLRTTKEDFVVIKKQAVLAAAKASEAAANSQSTPAPSGSGQPGNTPTPVGGSGSQADNSGDSSQSEKEDEKPKAEANGEASKTEPMKIESGAGVQAAPSTTGGAGPPAPLPGQPTQPVRRQPWEYVEEVMALLKTAYPLLTLSMETMVDQVCQRLKPSSDEDIYRLVVALMSDGVQQLSKDFGDTSMISPNTEGNLLRFAESMKPNHMRYKALFEEDFIKSKPTLIQLVDNFRSWRDKLEIVLDNRPRKQQLEFFSHYLVEFEYQKFDEIEVPGQYFLLKDNNKDFIRIDRFTPEVEVFRGHRRLTIRGHDGSLHPFVVQHPAARNCRREERIIQLFRIFNSVLERKKESRRRGLLFHLPIIVPLSPMVRIIQDDTSYKSLQDIFEQHCVESGIHKEEPILYFIQRMREMYLHADASKKGKVEILNLKTEIMDDIATRMVPENILTKYMLKHMKSYTDLWNMRKQFTNQMAAVTYMTYLFSISHRLPSKFNISMATGNVWASDLLPSISSANFLFQSTDSVPFRLTPNIQHFITPIGLEGVFTTGVMSISRALTEPESELEDYISIFVRDELITFQNVSRKPPFGETQLRDLVNQNCDLLVKRTHALGCKAERERPGVVFPGLPGGAGSGATGGEGNGAGGALHPANQTILDLMSQAVNPLKLAQMEPIFLPML
ncbi:hypothetical protein BC830DRAFT_946632 [Chytriomyces sp. MP71]|nr:hypothetical protein BC830DRAFT_946632 [Chytriomyces sp. MP71]